MLRNVLWVTIFSGLAAAQPVVAGLKIGAPLNDAFTTSTNLAFPPVSANDYTLGPFVEFRLPFQLSVEADALYRGYTFFTQRTSTSASSWEFPIVAKYHFLKGPVNPYLEGGLAFRHLTDVSELPDVTQNHTNDFGVVLGAGVRIKLLVLRLSPEIRYTRYTWKDFSLNFQSVQNQAAFLVGIGL